MLTWIEDHREQLLLKRKEMAANIKRECFPLVAELSSQKINDKIGNLKKNYSRVKKKLHQSGFGIPEGADEKTISDVLNRKCRWYNRIDDLWGVRESVAVEDELETDIQTQPVQSATMQGDSFSGLADMERPRTEEDDFDEYDSEFDVEEETPAVDTLTTPRVVIDLEHDTPRPASRQLSQHTSGSTEGSQRKRKRRVDEFEDMLKLVEHRINANKEALIEAARIKSLTREEIAREETRRHESTMSMISTLVSTQNDLLRAQQEQAKRHDALMEKLLEKLN